MSAGDELSRSLALVGIGTLLDNHGFAKMEQSCAQTLVNLHAAYARMLWREAMRYAELGQYHLLVAVSSF